MSSDLIEKLSAPFPVGTVSWRVGPMMQDKSKGMVFPYIDARDVQDRLNEVCGHEWQVKHHYCGAHMLACEIGIKIDGEWLWRGDGAGTIEPAENSGRLEEEQDMARKGAFSDSFKRAAVRWGIGRYLYDIESPWVALEQKGRSYVIAERAMSTLRSILMGNAKPADAPAPARTANGKHPKWDYAGARFREIERAMKGAESEKVLDDIIDVNDTDIKLIGELHWQSYQRLMILRDEMLDKLRRPPRVDAESGDGLTGEP